MGETTQANDEVERKKKLVYVKWKMAGSLIVIKKIGKKRVG
jgi:hypothetical protein